MFSNVVVPAYTTTAPDDLIFYWHLALSFKKYPKQTNKHTYKQILAILVIT